MQKELRVSIVSDLTLDIDLHKTREVEISKALASRGHQVTLVGVTSRQGFEIGDKRINLILFPIRRLPFLSHIIYTAILFLILPVHILIEKPDLVIMDPDLSVVSSIPTLALRFSRAKFILDIKSIPVEVRGSSARLAAFWFRVSVLIAKKTFHAIEAVTPMMRSEIRENYSINHLPMPVWSNGVPLKLFNPKNFDVESVRLRNNLGLADSFVVFYHGVFSASRGLTETIEAMRIIKNTYPEIMFFLLGTGPAVDQLTLLIRQFCLQKNVVLHAPVTYADVPKYIGLSDVCIVPLPNIPYWKFQSPMKLLEYLAMEKVVLVTDIPAHKAVAGNEKCCIYLKSNNPEEIANSIEYAFVRKTKLAEWGKIGRSIIHQNYTWDKIAEDIENSYCRLTMGARLSPQVNN